ncbi:ATP-dependent nuclease [Shewanella algae]|uniref:ATP-dependent nuclease n=1 Tax=Shewanella algae TaxID=38313 RepID=UPI001AAE1615|nr:AAA family ATPase [Shewanella algae]MBO2702213.1 AAA family ATPase [Shewanella algae]
MKIKSIAIQNYKTAKNLSLNFFEDITLIVGKNNIGKSNSLKALQIFFDYLKFGHSDKLSAEDFSKKSSTIKITVEFTNIETTVEKIKEKLATELQLSRPNKDRVKALEDNIHCINAIKTRSTNNSLKIELKIQRQDIREFSFELIYRNNSRYFQSYLDLQKKRQAYESHSHKSIEFKKAKNVNEWIDYNWISEISSNTETIEYQANDEKFQAQITQSNKKYTDQVETTIKEYIVSSQHFFYIPAYRGEKPEREEAVNTLFDLIIDDLVNSKKGASTDYDTITDAIWGTGKNTNKYNLNDVIESRVKTLTTGLKTESISSITNISFKPFERREIRRNILKILIGTPKIILDDGVETDFESKGTGIQSSFMITLMKSLSKMSFSEDTNIILAVEEPEAFAHPQLIREIISKIVSESEKDIFQFLITTHSSVVVNYVDFNKIQRLHSEGTITTNVTNVNGDTLTEDDWRMINRSCDLNISEVVFSDLVLFVEGEGDKIVLEKLFRKFYKKFANNISIISISGNLQIFKLIKMLNYYDVKWIMVVDKDSFVKTKFSESSIEKLAELQEFFKKHQIGEEYKTSFENVLNNVNVASIKISGGSPTSVAEAEFFKKTKSHFNFKNDTSENLHAIISARISDINFNLTDADSITVSFNKKLEQNEIPFFCMTSDLEGFIVNKATLDTVKTVCKKNFKSAYQDLEARTQNFSQDEMVIELQSFIGSKTHRVNKVKNGAGERKKPHIPIEIISEFIESKGSEYKRDNLERDFLTIKQLAHLIESKLSH